MCFGQGLKQAEKKDPEQIARDNTLNWCVYPALLLCCNRNCSVYRVCSQLLITCNLACPPELSTCRMQEASNTIDAAKEVHLLPINHSLPCS